jgi:hypothetical protein
MSVSPQPNMTAGPGGLVTPAAQQCQGLHVRSYGCAALAGVRQPYDWALFIQACHTALCIQACQTGRLCHDHQDGHCPSVLLGSQVCTCPPVLV